MVEELIQVEKLKKKACLIVLGGHDVGRVIPVADTVGETVIIGRHPDCTVVLRDEGISRRHASVQHIDAGKILIQDLGSTNGIYFKGQKVSQTVLSDGQKILLGRRIMLKFTYQDKLEESYLREMYETTTRDGLTGIFNRNYLMQKMKTDLSFARRHRIPYTLLLIDIDFFKRVNDTYGHQSGDQVLIGVAKGILSAIRTEDVLARYGGEEFAILAPGTDADGAQVLGERVRSHVATIAVPALDGSGNVLKVTASVGVATVHPKAIVDSAKLISVADNCLYEAKRNGRNRVVCTLIT